jgi:hypothetical protein
MERRSLNAPPPADDASVPTICTRQGRLHASKQGQEMTPKLFPASHLAAHGRRKHTVLTPTVQSGASSALFAKITHASLNREHFS